MLIVSREPQSTCEHRPSSSCWGQSEPAVLSQLASLLKGFVEGDCTWSFPELGELTKTNLVCLLPK